MFADYELINLFIDCVSSTMERLHLQDLLYMQTANSCVSACQLKQRLAQMFFLKKCLFGL